MAGLRGRPGWPSAWSAPAAWAPCSVPRSQRSVIVWSRRPGCPTRRAGGPNSCCPEFRSWRQMRSSSALTWCCSRFPTTCCRGWSAAWRPPARAPRPVAGAHVRSLRRRRARSGRAGRRRPLALHPVMTFTGTEVDLARLVGATFGVTAPEVLRPVAEALVVEMGGEPVWSRSRTARSTTRRWRMRPTTWSPCSEAMDLLTAAGVERPGACSARCWARPSTTRCAPATPR